MKYGKLNIRSIDTQAQIAELNERLNSGEITESQYKKMKDGISRTNLMYILATNGGHTMKTKGMKKKVKQSIEAFKEQHAQQREEELREKLLEEIDLDSPASE